MIYDYGTYVLPIVTKIGTCVVYEQTVHEMKASPQ